MPDDPAPADSHLKQLFRPETIALVGVSSDPRNLGQRYLRHLLSHGFPPERLQLVHPKATEIQGIRAVPSVSDLETVPNLALVLTGGNAVPGLISELVDRGVGAFNVFANDGAVLDAPEALQEILSRSGARLLGPNSPGFISASPPVAAHASQFLGSATLRSRPVGIISHSGAIGGIVGRAILEAGSGFDSLICTGNEIDLGLGECLHYLVTEERPRVVGLFVETIRDIDEFRQALEVAAAADIRVCALKVGWSDAAQRAARHHTGAEMGRVEAFDAELRRYGATLCRDLAEMVAMLVIGALPRGRQGGLAIAATSGGLTSVLGDAATACGFDVPDLPGHDNPWDTDIQTVHEPEVIGKGVAAMLSRDDVTAGVFAVSAQPDHVWEGLITGLATGDPGKPCLVIPYAGMPRETFDLLPAWAAVWTDVATGLRALQWAAEPTETSAGAVAPAPALAGDATVQVSVTIEEDPIHGLLATVTLSGDEVSVLLPASAAEVARALRADPRSSFATLAAFSGAAIIDRLADDVVRITRQESRGTVVSRLEIASPAA